MALWLRFEQAGRTGFGTLDGATVHVHEGDLFEGPRPTGETLLLEAVTVRRPVEPPKLVGLVSNYRAAVEKAGGTIPAEPLWFIKAASAYLHPGQPIRLPPEDLGKIIYEGELGLVIGREARRVDESRWADYVFGYTCLNDVTALDLIGRDPSYAQWSRAKSQDTFGPFGPVIATGLDPGKLNVRTLVKGKVRQDYPTSDMIFPPSALVSRLSHDLTLLPGDVIACGTSVGIGVLRPGATVEVAIDGIGVLVNPVAGPEERA